MYAVQISAKILTWPPACACCCGRPTGTMTVTSSREVGKRVVHVTSKSWKVPYCRRCVDHIDASSKLRNYSPRRVIHGSVAIALIGGLVTCGCLLIFWLGGGIGRWGTGLSLLLASFTLGLVVYTFSSCQKRFEKRKAEINTERARLERAVESLVSPSCACKSHVAVSYEGWQATVHTFVFTSKAYAGMFRAANPGKCLQDGQIHH